MSDDAIRTSQGGLRGYSKSAAIAAVFCVSMLFVSGCTADSAEPPLTDPDAAWQGGEVTGSANPSPRGVTNISTWSLPLDEFMPRFGNLDNYAEQLLLAPCLDIKGIDWPVPWQDVNEPFSPVYNTAGRRIFNLDVAQQYGFRTNLEPSKSSLLWETFLMHQPSEPGFQDAFDACLADIRKQFPVPGMEDNIFVLDLAAQVREEVKLDSEVQEAATQWASCMARQGVGQLPENPDEFPGPDLLQELGALPPLESVEPSTREVAVAVAHAECLYSSGFSEKSYEKEWELQAAAVQRERVKLDRIRDAIRERQEAVEGIIAANAPKA